MNTPAKGWAVAVGGEIDLKTVSPSRRGAIVNWLCTEAGVMILKSHSDAEIENIWQDKRGEAMCQIVTVT